MGATKTSFKPVANEKKKSQRAAKQVHPEKKHVAAEMSHLAVIASRFYYYFRT
jgi:hypothetical protein